MLGDALVYGFSLFVVARSARWQAWAVLAKGVFMLAFGLAVVAEAVHKIVNPIMPAVDTMLGSHWPDVIVGAIIASIFLMSASGVLRGATSVWHAARPESRISP